MATITDCFTEEKQDAKGKRRKRERRKKLIRGKENTKAGKGSRNAVHTLPGLSLLSKCHAVLT
jgi:hypothetical protein